MLLLNYRRIFARQAYVDPKLSRTTWSSTVAKKSLNFFKIYQLLLNVYAPSGLDSSCDLASQLVRRRRGPPSESLPIDYTLLKKQRPHLDSYSSLLHSSPHSCFSSCVKGDERKRSETGLLDYQFEGTPILPGCTCAPPGDTHARVHAYD